MPFVNHFRKLIGPAKFAAIRGEPLRDSLAKDVQAGKAGCETAAGWLIAAKTSMVGWHSSEWEIFGRPEYLYVVIGCEDVEKVLVKFLYPSCSIHVSEFLPTPFPRSSCSIGADKV